MATIKCSACLNDFEIEISDSLKSIQCPVCSEWIKVRSAVNQTTDSTGVTKLSAERNSGLVKNVVLGLKASGFFKGWIRFLLAGLLIVVLAFVMNGFSVLIKKQSAEIKRQKELIENLKLELSSIKGVNSSNDDKIQSDGVLISEFKTQVQLYQGKKPDIVEYIGEVKKYCKGGKKVNSAWWYYNKLLGARRARDVEQIQMECANKVSQKALNYVNALNNHEQYPVRCGARQCGTKILKT